MSSLLQGPRIVVPPPFIFVAAWGAAWGLGRRLPFEIDGRGVSALQLAVAVLFLAAGLGLMFWALATFIRFRTPVLPIRPARVIVSEGPFRFSRNPMYVGLSVAYVGLAFALNQAWPLVVLPGALAALLVLVIFREERYLRSAFSLEYEEYCRRVRRWL